MLSILLPREVFFPDDLPVQNFLKLILQSLLNHCKIAIVIVLPKFVILIKVNKLLAENRIP